jgi:hypothetical protein
MPTSGGITQARKRLGPEPLERLFDQVAAPVAGLLTRGAFLRDWRLMAIEGFGLDVPDTLANAAAFGYPAGTREHPAFPSHPCGCELVPSPSRSILPVKLPLKLPG